MYKVDINRLVKFSRVVECERSIIEKNFSGISKAIVFSLDTIFPTSDIWTIEISKSGKTIYLRDNSNHIVINDYIKLVTHSYLKEMDLFFNNKGKDDVISVLNKYKDVLSTSVLVVLKKIEREIELNICTNKEVATTSQVDDPPDKFNSLRSYMQYADNIEAVIKVTLRENKSYFSNALKLELPSNGSYAKNGYLDVINSEVHYIYGNDFFNMSKLEIKGMLEKIINMSTKSELVFYAIKANIPLIAKYIKNYNHFGGPQSSKEDSFIRFNGISIESEYVRIANKQVLKYVESNRSELAEGINSLNRILNSLNSKKHICDNKMVDASFFSERKYVSDLSKFIVGLLKKRELNCTIESTKNGDRVSVLYKVSGHTIYRVNLTSNADATIINTKSIKVEMINEIKRIITKSREWSNIIYLIDKSVVSIKEDFVKALLSSIPDAKLHFLEDSNIVYRRGNGKLIFKNSKGLVTISKVKDKYLFKFNDDNSEFSINDSLSIGEMREFHTKVKTKVNSFLKEQVELLKEEFKIKNIKLRDTLKDLFPNTNLDIIIEFIYLYNEKVHSTTSDHCGIDSEYIVSVLVEGEGGDISAYSEALKHVNSKDVYGLISKLKEIGLISTNEYGSIKFNRYMFEYILKVHSKALLDVRNVKSSEAVDVKDAMKLPIIDLSRYLVHREDLSVRDKVLLTRILDKPEDATKIRTELAMNFRNVQEVKQVMRLKYKLADGDNEKLRYLRQFI